MLLNVTVAQKTPAKSHQENFFASREMAKDAQVMFVDNTKIAFKAIDFEGRPGVGVEVEVEDRRGMIVLDCASARDIAQNLMKTADISERESEPQGTC